MLLTSYVHVMRVKDTSCPVEDMVNCHWQEVAVFHGSYETIDTVTNYPEIVRLNNMTSLHIAQQFENLWLSRYPHPVRCIYDQGPEFMGHDFQSMLNDYAIIHQPCTVKHRQLNSTICEQLHQTIVTTLRPFIHAHPP